MKGRPFKTSVPQMPGRSVFDLSYSKLFTCDMGQLIPVLCDEVVPGDFWKIGNEIVIRFQPLVAPILHEINCYVHYFFVPYRLLWTGWEAFISGGVLGTDASTPPRWPLSDPSEIAAGTLWDFLGFPPTIDPVGSTRPLDFNRRAYYLIWNEFYRDETQQSELDITSIANYAILNRAWEKDYFTSALPWQQRGTAPALPISGLTSAVWDDKVDLMFNDEHAPITAQRISPITYLDSIGNTNNSSVTSQIEVDDVQLNDNVVDLSSATTFDVADLRLAFQIQKWMERNARSGVRYTEFLHAHFGVSPRDDRLQRPEYIGGSKSPVIISEVLQTSQTDPGVSPQGNMAGHGISASTSFCGKYYATEYGLIMGLMSVMPKPMYQQGINRQWQRRTRYDFYFPEFAHLSEQAIEKVELYATNVENDNLGIFGYQGRYDEMRYKPNMVCGKMRDDFDFWHLGRVFGSAPALNSTFLQCIPDKRIFAAESEPGLIVSFGNLIKAIRPIPIVSQPGLIDH